jgi:hypothetical protein
MPLFIFPGGLMLKDFLNHDTRTATAVLNGVALVAELLFIVVAIKYIIL